MRRRTVPDDLGSELLYVDKDCHCIHLFPGVPFGEVGMVKDYLGVTGISRSPSKEHPKRRVEGRLDQFETEYSNHY